MIRKITLSLLACIGFCFAVQAQKCGFDHTHRELMKKDPVYAQTVNQFNTNVLNWMAMQKKLGNLLITLPNNKQAYEIPVVVHVVDTGAVINGTSPYSPSNGRIDTLIQYLTDAFQASYNGTPTHLLESAGGIRMPIVFKLAKRAPNCTATNGIVHVNGAVLPNYKSGGITTGSGPGASDASVKALSVWPSTEYYNIWIVNKIDGADGITGSGSFTAGYAYFPGAPGTVDGTVILASQSNKGSTTLTHELGHAFSLYHVFEDDDPMNNGIYQCPVAPGDFCADTRPMIRSLFNCPTQGNNSCVTGGAYDNTQRNFMDYSNCKDRYTPDQRTRVWNALMTFNTTRSSLISSLGATALPTTPMTAAACTPTGPTSSSTLGLRNVTIFQDGGVNPDTIIMNAQSGSYNTDGAHYVDRTCKHRAELIAGKTYSVSVTVGGSNEFARVYIDYNNDGDFLDAGETIFSPGSSDNNTFTAATFTVPLTAVSCQGIRLRAITNNATGLNSCTSPINGQCEDYEVIIRGGSTSSNIPGIVTLNAPLGGNPSCFGSTNTVTSNHITSVTPLFYKWFRKSTTGVITSGPAHADSTFWTSNTWGNLDTVWVKMAYPGLCGIDTAISDSIVMLRPLTIPPTVAIGVLAGTNPTCIDDTVTLGVTTSVNPGGSPTYRWFKNGVGVTPGFQASSTLKIANGVSGDQYYVIMQSSSGSPCALTPGQATSNTVSITHTTKPAKVGIALTTGLNPGCPGQLLTFTATDTTGGTAPMFQWKVNGINSGVPTPSKTFTGAFNNNDVISVTLTSSSTCAVPATANSNTIPVVHNAITANVTIAQVGATPPTCSGYPASFSATATGTGVNPPQYQWLLNGNPVSGANNSTFTSASLRNNDVIACILISTDPCVINPLDTSNVIQTQITQSLVPSVSFTITKGVNPGCLDSLIEFTATATNAGVNPQFEWYVNNFDLNLNSNVYTTTNMLNGDAVVAQVKAVDGGCYLPDSAYSAPMLMVRSPTPNPPIISLIGTELITNKGGSYVWYGPAGLLTGGTDGKYHPTELGQYWALTNNNGCFSKPSNKLTITLLDINTYDLSALNIYPNPTTGELVLDWGRTSVTMDIDVVNTMGQKLLHFNVAKEARKVLDLNNLANGVYYIMLTDDQGKTGSARITVAR